MSEVAGVVIFSSEKSLDFYPDILSIAALKISKHFKTSYWNIEILNLEMLDIKYRNIKYWNVEILDNFVIQRPQINFYQ